jgi:hypothetical protein
MGLGAGFVQIFWMVEKGQATALGLCDWFTADSSGMTIQGLAAELQTKGLAAE